jgi:hypothetical protein
MLADRWVCSVARLQRWRTVGEGPQYLKIVGKVLYRLKDIEAYEEACLVRKVFRSAPEEAPNGLQIVRTTWNQFEIVLAGQNLHHHKPPQLSIGAPIKLLGSGPSF